MWIIEAIYHSSCDESMWMAVFKFPFSPEPHLLFFCFKPHQLKCSFLEYPNKMSATHGVRYFIAAEKLNHHLHEEKHVLLEMLRLKWLRIWTIVCQLSATVQNLLGYMVVREKPEVTLTLGWYCFVLVKVHFCYVHIEIPSPKRYNPWRTLEKTFFAW